MSSQSHGNRTVSRLLMTPAVASLLLWMLVPLGMTIYFSLIYYNLMSPDMTGWAGLANYEFFITNPAFGDAVWNTLLLLGSTVLITVGLGLAIAERVIAAVTGHLIQPLPQLKPLPHKHQRLLHGLL